MVRPRPGRLEPAVPCSPRERGWSLPRVAAGIRSVVLPARAGMVPRPGPARSAPADAPRASGDGPARRSTPQEWLLCSPRERGWSPVADTPKNDAWVLPARAGMVPARGLRRPRPGRAPRASGDGPVASALGGAAHECSPRERGWSLARVLDGAQGRVLPARAGMVPGPARSPPGPRCAPRASGDGPRHPAHRRRWPGAPRASGDGPAGWEAPRPPTVCSPRERGWSPRPARTSSVSEVLPARAGMVPDDRYPARAVVGAPRASGDGPYEVDRQAAAVSCSPREQGWSRLPDDARSPPGLLPAHAGPFHLATARPRANGRAPHIRGDGPVLVTGWAVGRGLPATLGGCGLTASVRSAEAGSAHLVCGTCRTL